MKNKDCLINISLSVLVGILIIITLWQEYAGIFLGVGVVAIVAFVTLKTLPKS